MMNKFLLLTLTLTLISCGSSISEIDYEATDVTQGNYFSTAIDEEENGVFIDKIDQYGPVIDLRFKGQDATDFANLMRGSQMEIGIEVSGFGLQVLMACLTIFSPEGERHDCNLQVNGREYGQAIRDISLEDKSFQLVFGEPTEPGHDTIDRFITTFNIDPNADYEFESSDGKFRLTYNTSKNEMEMIYKDQVL